MAAEWFLEHTTHKGLRFKIVKLDKATMKATLLGDTGVPFDRDISEDSLKKFGYAIVKREAPQQESSNV